MQHLATWIRYRVSLSDNVLSSPALILQYVEPLLASIKQEYISEVPQAGTPGGLFHAG
jgi:malate synthase